MKKSFTLVELMIVIAILAILSAIVIFTLNPSKLFDNFRDTRRVSDIQSINKAIVFMESWNANGVNYGNNMTVYLSLPDTSSTCSSYALPTLATGYTYSCKPTSTFKNTDSTGWIPIDFTVSNSNRYITTLPVDPINDSTYFYSYFPGGSYELIARLKNSNNNSANDNGYLFDCYETGSPNRTKMTPISRNIVYNGNFDLGFSGWAKTGGAGSYTLDSVNYNNSGFSFRADSGRVDIATDRFYPVDISRNYKYRGYLKSAGSAGDSSVYFGLKAYDKDFLEVFAFHTNFDISTKTYLTQQLNPGDTIVYINDATNWKNNDQSVFHRKFAIYPYNNYDEYTYTRLVYQYDSVDYINKTITLSQTYNGLAKPVGTKVSNNAGSEQPMYVPLSGSLVSSAWSLKETTLQKTQIPSTSLHSVFRYGTKYVKPFLWMNFGQTGNYTSFIDDIELYIIE